LEPFRQPRMHVHVGAVEERIALREQCDVAARLQVRGDPVGGFAVEVLDRAGVAAGMVGGLGRDRVDEMLLDLTRPKIRFGDPTRDAAAVPGAVVRDDVGLADHPRGLDRDEFGIAGPEAHTPEGSPAHSASLAIELTAAAAIALPPRRPWTTRYAM